jgi:outer membrane receptor protein involved in Fe transport
MCGASTVSLAAPALAQQAAPPPAVPAAAPAEDQGSDVVVTGSRTIRTGNNSPSPVTVVSTQDLLRTSPGQTIAETLNTLPAFAGSRGATSNPTSIGSQGAGNGSANQLNLRNLGTTRTLILMDGKRVAPTLFNGVVDVDIIPQALVQRVDIVTGGVSAVYGSDAISGVVNYIIDHKFKGLRVDASAGVTQYGDDPRYDITAAWGKNLTDRLHVEASYEYRYEGGVDARSSRAWLQQVGVSGSVAGSTAAAGTAANPYALYSNLRQSNYAFGGLITNGALKGQVFKANGLLSPFVPGTLTGNSALQVGGDGAYWDSGLVAKLSGHQMFARADYEISDDVRFYAQVSGDIKRNVNEADTAQLTNATFSRTNAFLPAAVQALIPTTQPTFTLSEFMSDVPRAEGDARSKQFIYSTGLAGKVSGWAWNIDFSHGVSQLNTYIHNDVNRQKLAYALDAVTNSAGQTVCNVTITNPGLADNCVPINVFGPTAASPAAAKYITDDVNFRATTIQDDVTAGVSGTLFSGWAGDIGAALTAEYRKISYRSTANSTPNDLINCTGIRYNCTVGGALNDFQFGQSPNGISNSVWEVAGETNIPLLKDSFIGKAQSLNAAARYTHYQTSGSYWTWKIGLDWKLFDSLRFRGTRSRDIRAPTLYDLFAPTSSVPVRPTDLLTGLSPTVPSLNPANPNLTAEIGNTWTAGLVFTPMHNLSFAVDAYDVKISNAVTQIDGSNSVFQSLCYASGGTSQYCALQVRPNGYTSTAASNVVTAWIVENVNLSQVETWGVDFEANYATRLFSRPASLRALVAWQPHIYYRQPDVPTIDQGGAAFGPTGYGATPRWRATVYARFSPFENFTVDVQERWRSAMKLSGDPTQVFVSNHIDSFATTTINLAWDVPSNGGKQFEFYANVGNVFNANPPIGGYSGNGTRAGLRDGFALGDDPRGRNFTFGVRLKL